MPETPGITVAVPTFNGARHLADALRSVRDQAGVEFNWLISDDRSDDDTLAIARDVAGDRARVVVNSERLGLAGNWNQAIRLARTPWVALFHQDDVMRPGHLAAHVAATRAEPSAGLIASAAEVIDDDGRPVPKSEVGRGGCGPRDRRFPAGEFVRELVVANPLRCSAVTTSKAAHEAVGGFDPRYRYVVDWDFWARVAQIRPVAWLARPTVAIRWHAGSETHRFHGGTADLDETAQLLREVERAAFDWPGRRAARRRADRRLARAWLNRAYLASKAGDPGLARTGLRRAIGLDPAVAARVAADPRLAWRLLVGTRPSRRSDPKG